MPSKNSINCDGWLKHIERFNMDSIKIWFYLDGNNKIGPFSISEMETFINKGILNPNTIILLENDLPPRELRNVQELVMFLPVPDVPTEMLNFKGNIFVGRAKTLYSKMVSLWNQLDVKKKIIYSLVVFLLVLMLCFFSPFKTKRYSPQMFVEYLENAKATEKDPKLFIQTNAVKKIKEINVFPKVELIGNLKSNLPANINFNEYGINGLLDENNKLKEIFAGIILKVTVLENDIIPPKGNLTALFFRNGKYLGQQGVIEINSPPLVQKLFNLKWIVGFDFSNNDDRGLFSILDESVDVVLLLTDTNLANKYISEAKEKLKKPDWEPVSGSVDSDTETQNYELKTMPLSKSKNAPSKKAPSKISFD